MTERSKEFLSLVFAMMNFVEPRSKVILYISLMLYLVLQQKKKFQMYVILLY